jgi:dienelactone hydrolase
MAVQWGLVDRCQFVRPLRVVSLVSDGPRLAMPAHALMDQVVAIRCAGLIPGRRVVISAYTLVRTTVTVRQGDVAVSGEIVRAGLSASCVSQAVCHHGLVGTLFHQRGTTGRPELVLGGSEGGQPDLVAALLASHGYTALALTYFGAAGLPDQLRRVPIDYFMTALGWLADQAESRGGRVAIYGNSKGGEAALLVGSLSDRVAGVAAMVPSGVVITAAGGAEPSWQWRAGGLPTPLPGCRPPTIRRGETVVLADGFPDLDGLDGSHPSAIAVERIRGPVLIATASDDAVLPARFANARAAVRAWKASLDLLARIWSADG